MFRFQMKVYYVGIRIMCTEKIPIQLEHCVAQTYVARS